MKRLRLQPEALRAAAVFGISLIALLALSPDTGKAQGQGLGPGASKVVLLRPTGPVPGQYVVVFEDDVADPHGLAQALARQQGLALRHTYAFALNGFAAGMPAAIAEDLAEHPDVAYVEPDVFAHTAAQTIPSGVLRVQADLNPIANIDGSDDPMDVDIAILDTGLDLDHPDLNVVKWTKCIGSGCSNRRKGGNDDNGHGTHVAGTVAAKDNNTGVVGVAPGARLWAVKVLDAAGNGFFSDVIQGIDYVTANADQIEVANMSLSGIGKMDSFRTAIQNSVAAGVVYVVAAGNNARDIFGSDGSFGTGDDNIPAAYPEVITVSAIGDFDGQPGGFDPQTVNVFVCNHSGDDVFACLTNYASGTAPGNPVVSPGGAIDLAAPGVNIYSTWPAGGYNTKSGTSMAAPHVAGAAALEIAANGRAFDAADVADIRQALIDAAEPQADWGPADTKDPDDNPEGLVDAAGGAPVTTNMPPAVTIANPAEGAQFDVGASITFEGSANDAEDGDLTGALAWTSDKDGEIGTTGSFSTNGLSANVHVITASVTDTGAKSGSDSLTITVGAPPPQAALVQVTDVTAGTEGGKYGEKHVTVVVSLVDDLGAPVAGASLTLVLSHADGPWSGTGTTGGDGTVKFSRKNAPQGCHTAEVTEVIASGLTWDNQSPQVQVCKP